MFGFIAAQIETLSEEELDHYKAAYCGLCRSLKERHGNIGRATLSYDFTFYVLLCDSLHEPQTEEGLARCVMHPAKARPFYQSPYSDKAADYTVLLAYHKCLDDCRDTGSAKSKIGEKLLRSAYKRVQRSYPDLTRQVEYRMGRINAMEAHLDEDPDPIATEFGLLFGEIFAHDQGFWSDALGLFGAELGRFVYMMDGAVDLEDDLKEGSYNPFRTSDQNPETMQVILQTLAGRMTDRFQRLPLERDLHLMESVLYAGVWREFNNIYGSRLGLEDASIPKNIDKDLIVERKPL